jgi:hypothetical protein
MRLTIDLNARNIEVDGDDDFVKSVNANFKDQLCSSAGATYANRSWHLRCRLPKSSCS